MKWYEVYATNEDLSGRKRVFFGTDEAEARGEAHAHLKMWKALKRRVFLVPMDVEEIK